MSEPRRHEGSRVAVLTGAGLARASAIPDVLDPDGTWRGHPLDEVASLDAWARDSALVLEHYDERRIALAQVLPNAGHNALARLQHALGTTRCTLITENIDGLLLKASAPDVIELYGSLFRLRCAADPAHPQVGVFGAQNPARRCSTCGAALRPDVVWPGEPPYQLERARREVGSCDVFMAVEASVSPVSTQLVELARASGARCIEVSSEPSGGPYDEVVTGGSEHALRRVIGRWLDEETTEY